MSGEVDPSTDEDTGLRHAFDASLTKALWIRVYIDLLAGPLLSSEAERFATGFDRSIVASVARWLADATRHSILYRWLTTEPDPEVIVIDLRETFTVGPVIVLLECIVRFLAPAWHASALKRVADGLVPVLGVAAESRTGRAIVRLFEPPEPPEGRE